MGTATGWIGGHDAVRRLLQRVGLGPRPGELDAAVARGFDATVSALTQPASGPDAGVAATPLLDFGAPAPPLAKSASIETRQAQRREQAVQARQLQVWWLDRMARWTRRFWSGWRGFGTAISPPASPRSAARS